MSAKLIQESESSIKNQIYQKQQLSPYFGTINDAEKILTDFDHFPYTRFYRGEYSSSDPIVIEREAGWRPQKNKCYTSNCRTEPLIYTNNCFETACSTVLPCYQKQEINNNCIVLYR